ISNGLAIGNNEKEYIDKLAETCIKLVNYERQARDELVQKRKIELEDNYYRSLGLIKHCRLLTSGEAVKALTDLRLGIVLGWSKLDIIKVNSLLLLSQKAHIQYLIGNSESSNLLIDSKRAELVRISLGLGDKMEASDV
ncbi:MAG: hypothetical protein KAR21_03760, partial [Spirochaetales bacterium]|nr:hypothetical protein [Spirochaetales bacterium]